MPNFQYTAREQSGQQVEGVLSAASQQEALNSLATQQLFPVRIGLLEEEGTLRRHTNRGVRARHLAIFYTQLADLLRSGVPLLRSLELLERKKSQPALTRVIQDVREQVAEGTQLAEAMCRHPKVFRELAVGMVRAGEEAGFLEDVLSRIAAFTDHQEDLKNRVMGAMVYPLFLVVMGTSVVTAMMVFFVPRFAPIFQRMTDRGALPAPTWRRRAMRSRS